MSKPRTTQPATTQGRHADSGAPAPSQQGHAAGHAHVMADRAWLVLARRSYDEPLHQVGTITADDVDLARVYARTIYDEFAWVEMAIVPRDAIVTVIES
jgi:hypothetical protein